MAMNFVLHQRTFLAALRLSFGPTSESSRKLLEFEVSACYGIWMFLRRLEVRTLVAGGPVRRPLHLARTGDCGGQQDIPSQLEFRTAL